MRYISIIFAFLILPFALFAKESGEGEAKGFDAGKMIIEHVADAHEIHFVTLHEGTPEEHHVSLPLPIILYTADRGVEVFSSANFHNDKHQHDRYALHEGKIVIVDEAGNATEAHPLDFSITKNAAGALFASLIVLFVFFSVAGSYKKRSGLAPKGLQSFIEPLILFIRDEVAKPSIGEKHMSFMPYLLTIFFFILVCNFLGLIPFIGGFNITGNIAVTLVLALFTFLITTFRANGNYWKHIFATPGVPGWLLPLMIPIEVMGMLTKPVVLMLRLFANITAGHIIILSFISLIFIFANLYGSVGGLGVSVLSLAFAIFMNVMELLVAFLQAYVFTLLSAIYFGSAVEEHHHEEHH